MSVPSITLATTLEGARFGVASAAALALALGARLPAIPKGEAPAPLLIETAAEKRRPTLLSSPAARSLERALRDAGAERVSARGALCWMVVAPGEVGGAFDLAEAHAGGPVVAHLEPRVWRSALDDRGRAVGAVAVRADVARHRHLCSVLACELRAGGRRHAFMVRTPGLIAARRALSGIEPGGELSRLSARAARRFASEAGQALPLIAGGAVLVALVAAILATIGGAASAAGRMQRASDLAAVSAARSLRDDHARRFEPSRLPDGSENPQRLDRLEYLARARATAVRVAGRAGIPRRRVLVRFPRSDPAPLRASVLVRGRLRALRGGQDSRAGRVVARARAEAVLSTAAGAGEGMPANASGGGYSGPLEYRSGKPMRPDVAAAFDRVSAAASRAGLALVVNSGFRSDAEQARLFAAHPDPMWVARPGTSLHRCATELDLGPSTAYGWLAAHAASFGFVQRYSWEAWHYGYTAGPAPCSAAGDSVGGDPHLAGDAGGLTGAGGLPSFVPGRFRSAIARAAARSNVPAGLLAAQLMAESGFDPMATSAAGAQGIAQFMPATAAAYGLRDPFDPEAAIQAQARLMAENLRRFGSTALALAAYNAGPAPVAACHCVPAIPETQAYVARILGLMAGAGEITPPPLEVRLIG